MNEIISFKAVSRKIRDTVQRQALSPGCQADLGVDRSDRRNKAVDLFFFSPQRPEHRPEFEKIDVEKDADIIQDYIRHIA